MSELLNENFKSKLPLIITSLVLFTALLYYYSTLDISLLKLSNITEILKLLEKIYTPNVIIFAALLAAAASITAFSAFKLEKQQAAITCALFLIIAITLGAVLLVYLFAFLLLAIIFSVIAILSSEKEQNYDNAAKSTNRAFTALTILAFLGTILAVQSNLTLYQDNFLNGAVQIGPQVAGTVIPICAQAINQINASNAVDKNQITQITATSYNQYRNSITTSAPQLASQIPTFENLPVATQTEMIENSYASAIQSTKQSLNSIAMQLNNQAQNVKTPTLQETKTQLASMPQIGQMMQFLPVIIAFMTLVLLGIVMFFVKLLTAAFNFTLNIILTTPNTKEKQRGKK